MRNKKYLKPLAVGLLATNIIGFGTQTVAFAATDKAPAKEQAQKKDALKKAKGSMISFAANDGTDELSDLQRIAAEVIEENKGIVPDDFSTKVKEKAESQGVEFNSLEFVKGMVDEGIKGIAEITEFPPIDFLIPIIDAVFPEQKEDVWQEIRPKVEELINEKLDERFTNETLSTLEAKLKGLSTNLDKLKTHINTFNGHPKEPKHFTMFAQEDKSEEKEAIRTDISTVITEINGMEYEFKRGEYAVPSLPLYTQLANIHIGLLKTLVEHGEEWGYAKDSQTTNKAELQEAITKYSNQVYTTFNEGLEKIKQKAEAEGKDQNDRGGDAAVLAGSTVWNRVNKYVRTMTLTSLDFAALWSTLDTNNYPLPTHLQETRYVLSNVGNQYLPYTSYDNMLKQFGWGGYKGDLKSIKVAGDGRTRGLSETFNLNGVNEMPYTSGNLNKLKDDDVWRLKNKDIDPNNPITKSNFPKDVLEGVASKEDIPNGHKIAGITTGNTDRMDNFVTAYGRKEIHPENVVDGTKIEAIPAEKFFEVGLVENGGFFNAPEYITGANVMVSNQSGDSLKMRIKSTGNQKYQIRYRVATNADTAVNLQVASGDNNFSNIGNTHLPNTDARKNDKSLVVTGAQGTYQLIFGPTVELKEGINTLQITNNAGNKIALDRIELAPVKAPEHGNAGWQQIDGKWYYYNEDGSMAKGWKQLDNKWYYLNKDGSMAKGWKQLDNKWYYLNEDGSMAKGWKQLGDNWYYLNEDGSMCTGYKTGHLGNERVTVVFDAKNGQFLSGSYFSDSDKKINSSDLPNVKIDN